MFKNKSILVVDDDLGILEVVRIILEEKGYLVETASNFAEIKSKIALRLPDLVILDIWVSGLNGREVAAYFKKTEGTKNIPIIVMSALSESGQISKEVGANDYIEKPFEIKDFTEMVDKYI